MGNADLLESAKRYSFGMRFTTSSDLSSVKAYSDKSSFEIKKSISFDIENREVTSLEYFIGAVISSILLHISSEFKRIEVELEELEGKATFVLENPLTLLEVRGYDEPPALSSISIQLFLCADLSETEIVRFAEAAIGKSPIVNAIKDCIKLNIRYKIETC